MVVIFLFFSEGLNLAVFSFLFLLLDRKFMEIGPRRHTFGIRLNFKFATAKRRLIHPTNLSSTMQIPLGEQSGH